MIKLAVFDLDNTLAEHGKCIKKENADLLRRIEDDGVRIAIASGKPTYYLCGFMRQLGLNAPVLLGENGAVIQFDVDLPPRKYFIAEYPEEVAKRLAFIESRIKAKFPDMWFQPNEVNVTPFPTTEYEFDAVGKIIADCPTEGIHVYRHVDSFDIVPMGISKFTGLERLAGLLGITEKEVIAVGDSANDYPMFDFAGESVGVNVKEENKVDINFHSPDDALSYILKKIENE